MASACQLASRVEERLIGRNQLFERFFWIEAQRLAEASREMSERFLRGGRLADFPVVVNCDYIPRIQEVRASIYHVIRESLEVLHRGKA